MNDEQEAIHRVDPTVNPAGVYAFIILTQKATGFFQEDETLEEQIDIHKAVEANDPGIMYRLTVSYGMQEDYEEWELRLALEEQRPPEDAES